MFVAIGNKKTEYNKDMDFKYAVRNRLVNKPTEGIFIFEPVHDDPRFLCITRWDYNLKSWPVREVLFKFPCP